MRFTGAIGIKEGGPGYTAVRFSVNQTDKPSEEGIEGGRISELTLKNRAGDILAIYDGEWSVKPTCAAAERALEILLHELN